MVRRTGAVLCLLASFVALAALATYPLALQTTDHIITGRFESPGDDNDTDRFQAVYGTPLLNIWAMAWVNHQLPRDPLHLFDGNAFYPHPRSLALSEHLFAPALLGAPVYAATGNPVLTYNVVLLLSLAIAGLTMFYLCRELTGDGIASYAAGALYAFHTWNLNELVRIQIVSNQWFPLLVLVMWRYFREPSLRRAVVVFLAYVAQALSCMYWALYLPYVTAIVGGWSWWRYKSSPRRLFPLAAALASAVAVSLVFALPYLENSNAFRYERGVVNPLQLDRYLDVLRGNWLYDGILGTARHNENAAHFLGFAALALAAVGLWRGRGRERILFASLVVVGFVFSLGPALQVGDTVVAPGPYQLLYHFAPGFTSVRYPERFSVVLVLGLAPLVAMGLTQVRHKLGATAAVAMASFLFIEHLSIPFSTAPLPTGAAVPEAHRFLAEQADVNVVAEVPATPWRQERFDTLPMYLSTFHWKRTLQGFTGYFPPTYHFSRWRLFHFPQPESVRFLQKLGVETVVVASDEGRLPDWTFYESGQLNRRQRALAGAVERRFGPFEQGHLILRLRDATSLTFEPPEDGVALEEIPPVRWKSWSSRPGTKLALDRDPKTSWTTNASQIEGDYFAVRLAEPARVSRVSLEILAPYHFPMALTVLTRMTEQDEWVEVPFDSVRAYDRLFGSLLFRAHHPTLDIDFDPVMLGEIQVRVPATDPFGMAWTMAELRLYAEP